MGYLPLTGTLRALTPIWDLQPTAANTSGKGYRLPSATCITSSDPFFNDHPVWLNGINGLSVNNSTNPPTILQIRDLTSVPCGLIER
jgi:hypothetical protein